MLWRRQSIREDSELRPIDFCCWVVPCHAAPSTNDDVAAIGNDTEHIVGDEVLARQFVIAVVARASITPGIQYPVREPVRSGGGRSAIHDKSSARSGQRRAG